MKKVLVIVGPTAVGKSGLGVKLAHMLDGEIISGDSIQIYKGLDIGSGKVTEEEMDGIPHFGIDELDPKIDNYSVADFQVRARRYIEEISERGHLPIIVGGTGLYIKACLYDYSFEEEVVDHEDPYPELDNEALYELLKEKDPKACENIHMNNRRRVLRALQIAATHGRTKSEQEAAQDHEMIYDAFIVGLTTERERLYERISMRVDMMAESGLEDEIKRLVDAGVTFDKQAMRGIGYKEWNCDLKREEILELIKTHSRQFAKRQYTWFNHQMPVHWVNVDEPEEMDKMITTIREWSHE